MYAQRGFIVSTCVHICRFPTATQDPAAGTDSGGASGQRLVCSAQPGGRLGHHYASEQNAQTL